MEASEMTNEALANWLAIISGSADFRLPARYRDYLREATARLRQYDATIQMYRDEMAIVKDLRRRLKVAEDALSKCAKVQCDGYDDSISCEECDLACDGRCAQWMAKKALAAIREEGGEK